MRKAFVSGGLYLAGSTFVPFLLAVPAASAQTVPVTRYYDIPAQSLGGALRTFAEQSGTDVIFSPDVVRDKRSPGLRGRFSPNAGLPMLLKNSGLNSRHSGETTIVVERPPTATSAVVASPSPEQADAESNSDIVVTGSRIKRNGSEEPTPTLISTAEELQATSPDNLTQGLTKLPVFNNSGGQTGSGGRALGSGGVNQTGSFLNLRNFGTIRTLILLDGRRVPPTNFNGNVDVDTLPQALIQRVDVVTGGASAVYGSDAVTGVVNYILDRKFTGIKGTVQGGISGYGDNTKYRANLAVGTDLFGGRGHFIGSVEYSHIGGVARKESREWYTNQLLAGAGTVANPYHIIANGLNSNASFGGKITAVNGGSAPGLLNTTFNPDGTIRPFDPGKPSGTNNVSDGGDGAYHIDTSAAARLDTTQAFGRFQYDLTDTISAFAQVNYSRQRAIHTQVGGINRQGGSINAITIFKENAFLRPEVKALIPVGGSITVSQFGLYGRPIFDITTYVKTGTLGLEGKFIGDLRWDATYTHGEGRTKQDQKRNSNNNHFYAAVDAVRDPAGNIVCRVSTTANANLYPGCSPINIFGVGNASDASLNYTLNTTGWDARNTMDDFSANVTGDLFNNWAGPVSIATGFEYRKQKLNQTTTDDPNTALVTTGLRGVPNNSLSYAGVLVAPAKGSNEVWEVNGELVFPLLMNVRGARNLELNGAFRYTHYSNSGGATTYKIGGDYQPIHDLRFRVAMSRDIRAPTLNDLYAGTSLRVLGFNDPLTVQNKSATNAIVSNPNLVPEVSDMITAGFVYNPSWAPRLHLSVDYYHIKLKNAIGAVDNLTAVNQCTASGGTSVLCDNFIRPISNADTSAANFPTFIYTRSVNIARLVTKGVDVELGYHTDLHDIWKGLDGKAGLRVIGTYQPVLKSQSAPGVPFLNAAGQLATQNGIAGLADTRITVMGSYEKGPFSFNFQTNWSANQRWDSNPAKVYADPEIGSYMATDMRIGYAFEAASVPLEVFFAVNNVFDRKPRIYPDDSGFGQITPAVSGDDIIGRFFTLGAKFKF